jgi:hypothetical protein
VGGDGCSGGGRCGYVWEGVIRGGDGRYVAGLPASNAAGLQRTLGWRTLGSRWFHVPRRAPVMGHV